jgi:hypothetical protein
MLAIEDKREKKEQPNAQRIRRWERNTVQIFI